MSAVDKLTGRWLRNLELKLVMSCCELQLLTDEKVEDIRQSVRN